MYIYKSKTSNRKKYTVERVMYKIDEIDIVDSLPYIHTYTHTHTYTLFYSFIHSLTYSFLHAFSFSLIRTFFSLREYQSFKYLFSEMEKINQYAPKNGFYLIF